MLFSKFALDFVSVFWIAADIKDGKAAVFRLAVEANFGEILDNTRKIWYSHLDRGALHQEYPNREGLPKLIRGKGWVPKWAFLGGKLGWQ